MKSVLITLMAVALVSGVAYPGTNVPAADDGQDRYTRDTIIVPMQIRTTFTTKYPNASRVVWYRYNPDRMKIEPGVWSYYMDPNDYYVTFYLDDADYIAWFDNGSLIRTSRTIEELDLPANVRQVIHDQFPGYLVTEVDLETDKKETVYEVDLEKGDSRWVVEINSAGAILKKKNRSPVRTDVEGDMVEDFETRYPNATQVVWYKYVPGDRVEVLPSDWDYNMDENDYEVRFMHDGVGYTAYYDNGTWIRAETTVFDPLRLPTTVRNAINTAYPGYNITDVDREESANQILYEVEMENASTKCKIHYATDGTVVKKKCRDRNTSG